MANFTVNFNANTTGDHYICYRTQGAPAATPFNCTTENVTSTSGLISVTIEIPDNIYCAGVVFEGYIIAACEPQTDTTGNGFPDVAVLFTATFPQVTDPCPLYEIECTSVELDRNPTISNGGTGYVVGDALVFTTTNPADTIVLAVGQVTAVDPVTGAITTATISSTGQYSALPTVTVNSVAGANAVIAASLDPCPMLNLGAIGCNPPAIGPVTPFAILMHTETIEICADTTEIAGLADNFTATDISATGGGTCNCQVCKECTLVNNTGKGLNYSYQTCWDTDPQSAAIVVYTGQLGPGQTVTLSCVIESTVTDLYQSDGTLTKTFNPCP